MIVGVALGACAALLPLGSRAEGPCRCVDIPEVERILADVKRARELYEAKLREVEAGGGGGAADVAGQRKEEHEEQGRPTERCGWIEMGTLSCTPVVAPECKEKYCDDIWRSSLEHEAKHCSNANDRLALIGRRMSMGEDRAKRWLSVWNEATAYEVQERYLEGVLESLKRRFRRTWKGEVTYSRKADENIPAQEIAATGPNTRGGKESETLVASKRYRAKVRVDGERSEGTAEVSATEEIHQTTKWTGEVRCEQGRALATRHMEWKAMTSVRGYESNREASSPARATVAATPECDAVSVHVRVGRSAGKSRDKFTHHTTGGCGGEGGPRAPVPPSDWETEEVEFGVQAEIEPGKDRTKGSSEDGGVTVTWDLTAQ